MRNKIALKMLGVSIVLAVALVFAMCPPVNAAMITLSKDTIPPDVTGYFVGETISYKMVVTNPNSTYNWTGNTYDEYPNGTIVALEMGLVLDPLDSKTYYGDYVVTEADGGMGYALNCFRVEGQDGLGNVANGEACRNSTLLFSPPEFDFTYEQVCCFNISFCGWASDPGNITNHTWDFGDGYWYASDGAPGMVTHQYASGGYHVVELSGYDNEGAFNMTTKTVYVPCEPTAIVWFTPACFDRNGTYITFDGTSSYIDPWVFPYQIFYWWTFSDGINGSSDYQPVTSRWVNDTLEAHLTVSDGHCMDTVCVQINHCPTTIYVPDDYEKIQWAMDNATTGDMIIVRNGTYTENVDVYVPLLTIKSENGSASTTIEPEITWDYVFEVTANHVNISGFTIEGGDSAGIYLGSAVDHCNISNNNIFGLDGIYLNEANYNIIANNQIGNRSAQGGYGVTLYNSHANLLINNTVINFGGWGVYIEGCDNVITDSSICFNPEPGIMLTGSNNTLVDNNISYNGEGIWLYDAGDNIISSNRIFGSWWGNGIDMENSENNTLANNTIRVNCGGISLDELSNNNTIYNNYFNNTNNAWDDGNNIWNITKIAGRNIVSGSWIGGNYWSDYDGEDLDDDCLGDTLTPYNSSGNIVNGGDYLPLLLPYTHTDAGVTVDIELANPSEIEPSLPPDRDLSNAIVITVNVTDDTPGNSTDDAYTDIMINVGALDVATCEVFKEESDFLPEVGNVTTLPTVKPPGEAKFARDEANNSVISRLYVGDPLLAVIPPSAKGIFNTGFGTYPSISGTHNGTILPNQTITVSTLYTYPCAGTGGHTESIELYENDELIANGTWDGYIGDYHNITLHNVTGAPYVRLLGGHKYNYTIITGSYPQIIHEHEYDKATGGTITCTSFVDANGKVYNDWIPAIKFF